jgi:membrane associated rhomboid family serine protease
MTPWVWRLIVINVILYLLSTAAPAVQQELMLVPALILSRPWTPVTYMFLHGGIFHLLFNMLGLYFFGPRLEVELGGKDFLLLYGISGIAGGLFSFVTPFTAIIGASGAVFGVFLAFARYWPREQVFLWGILPVEARWLVVGMTALSLLGGFGVTDDNIAHFAHLGGFAGGYLFLLWRDRNTRAARFHAQMASRAAGSADVARWKAIDREKLHEVNREELDRILAKLQSAGPSRLTREERDFMDRFSGR